MKTKIILLFLFSFSLGTQAQYNTKNLALATEPASAKFTYGNMRIYPIYASEEFLKHNSGSSKYLTLKEALTKNKIKVSEINASSESAQVNTLVIQNISSDTVLILGGEIIEGGKQDRMIASDVILPPLKTKNLDVFCVEHGRWKTKSQGGGALYFNSSDATPVASPSIRKAGGVSKNQSFVWDEVKQVTDKNQCKTSTGAYTSLKTDSTYGKKMNGYRAFFVSILKSSPKIIGAIYVTGNRVIGCDMFESHDLLLKHANNLVDSYSTEAISNGQKVSIAYPTVVAYLNKIISDEKKQESIITENGTMLKNKGSKVHITYY